MTQPQKNTVLVFGIIAAIVSLPLTWFTLQNATIGAPFGMGMPTLTVHATGLNGYITFLVKTPIWLTIAIVIASNGLGLMSGSAMFDVPRTLQWIVAVGTALWIFIAFMLAIFTSDITIGIGAAIGFLAAIAPVFCLAIGEDPAPEDANTLEVDEAESE